MQKFDVIMTVRAKNDLFDIVSYLSKFSFEIAENYYELILRKVNSLVTFPKGYPSVRDKRLREKGCRWITARNYVIYFIVHEEKNLVVVERILYSRRAYDILL